LARAPTPLPPVFRSDDEEAELAVGELGASVETLLLMVRRRHRVLP